MENTSLIKSELIDKLCAKRQAMIALMEKQVKNIKESYTLCAEMNDMIPAHPLAIYDYLDIIFYDFKSAMGEQVRSTMPKDVNILTMSDKKISDIFTKILDRNLWKIIFNRLNINSLISTNAKQEFNETLKTDPLPFIPSNVESTLYDIMNRQDELLINGLLDSIQSVHRSYVCNDTFKFNSKTIFTNACSKSNSYYYLNDGPFKDTITFLSKIVFGKKHNSSSDKIVKDTYLWQIMTDYFTNEKLEHLDRDEVTFKGGKVVFFNKGTAHLVLDKDTVNFLNDQLSNTRTVPDKG